MSCVATTVAQFTGQKRPIVLHVDIKQRLHHFWYARGACLLLYMPPVQHGLGHCPNAVLK